MLSCQEPGTAELVDGSVISLRQLKPGDTDAIVQLYQSMTDEERYFRFFAMHPAGLDSWARSIAEPRDGQCSLGAFSAEKLLGVANFAACPEPGEAEVAVVVAHAEHLRGVGTALLGRLGQIAKANGLHRLVAEVLWENHPMLRVLADAGWPCARKLDGSVLTIEVDLDSETDLPER
ncbi:GNAT family N-acetyltransferase [Mycobacterium sp. OAS707]|uniref:GNAT family N-acetyltransferase n=1 Tax=Mycobacterium sp. OAS707 TaxID=2663822 RepID=UPI00178A5F05|nr:GNAT family N-acetyltransferase [Mycobacterium sp. OAS707]